MADLMLNISVDTQRSIICVLFYFTIVELSNKTYFCLKNE